MVAKAIMDLSQFLPQTHVVGHMLDLISTPGKVDDDLGAEEIKITPLSVTDHFLVGFRVVMALLISARAKG